MVKEEMKTTIPEEEISFRPISMGWYREGFTLTITEEQLERIVYKKLEEVLKAYKILIEYRNIPDDLAKKEITEFILDKRKEGIIQISVFDVISSLQLPPEQVDRIMEEFEKEGKISEVYG